MRRVLAGISVGEIAVPRLPPARTLIDTGAPEDTVQTVTQQTWFAGQQVYSRD